MKTIVEFKDGHTETFEDACPGVYCGEWDLCDENAGVVRDSEPLDDVARIIFEND